MTELLVRDAPAAAVAAVVHLHRYQRIPDVAVTAIAAFTPVGVMGITALAAAGLTARQGQAWRLGREEPNVLHPAGGVATPRASDDADRMKRVHDAVRLDRAAGQLDFSLDALAEEPR